MPSCNPNGPGTGTTTVINWHVTISSGTPPYTATWTGERPHFGETQGDSKGMKLRIQDRLSQAFAARGRLG